MIRHYTHHAMMQQIPLLDQRACHPIQVGLRPLAFSRIHSHPFSNQIKNLIDIVRLSYHILKQRAKPIGMLG
jgi:hypothetical protein